MCFTEIKTGYNFKGLTEQWAIPIHTRRLYVLILAGPELILFTVAVWGCVLDLC